jgi:PAS domain-containing protein
MCDTILGIKGTEERADAYNAEASFQDCEGMRRALTENTSDYVLVIGRDGNITYASPAVERDSG